MNLGIIGGAMSLNITYGLNYFLQELYIHYFAYDNLKPFMAPLARKETFKGWVKFLKLGVPGMFMQCFEWWAFEVLAILAGLLGTI